MGPLILVMLSLDLLLQGSDGDIAAVGEYKGVAQSRFHGGTQACFAFKISLMAPKRSIMDSWKACRDWVYGAY